MSDTRAYELTADKPGYGRAGQTLHLHPRAAEWLVRGGLLRPAVDPVADAAAVTGTDGGRPVWARTVEPSTVADEAEI